MTKPLTIHNAEIKTAAVEIQTLTISGKQVTLAVFRQLPDEPIIAEDGTLNGSPWGTVNYHPDKCADVPSHVHVVWQRGTVLLRSAVMTGPLEGLFRSPTGDNFLTACVWEHINGGSRHFHDQPLLPTPAGSIENYKRNRKIELSGIPVLLSGSKWEVRAMDSHADLLRHRNSDNSYWLERAEEALAKLREDFKSAWPEDARTADSHYEKLKAECAAEALRRTNYRDSLDVIAGLPQLFIAV